MTLRPSTTSPKERLVKRVQKLVAFTLIELLVVMVIIGILAAVALPHLGGFGRSNSMIAATRQVLDDVALARQKALLNRTPVYMVFLPPLFYYPPNDGAIVGLANSSPVALSQLTNLMNGQYTMYALLTLHNVGDQPGKGYPKYLVPWRRLPDGVTIAQEKFSRIMSIVDSNVPLNAPPKTYTVYPFVSNLFPFPSIEANPTLNPKYYLQLPYIEFTPSGSLATNQDDYIALTRASVFYPQDANGNISVDWVETPPGSSTNDYHLIHINWLTGRAKLERKEIQ